MEGSNEASSMRMEGEGRIWHVERRMKRYCCCHHDYGCVHDHHDRDYVHVHRDYDYAHRDHGYDRGCCHLHVSVHDHHSHIHHSPDVMQAQMMVEMAIVNGSVNGNENAHGHAHANAVGKQRSSHGRECDHCSMESHHGLQG